MAFDPNLVRLETSFGETMGRRAVRELLEREDRPTAIFAASDTMAIGGYKAARSPSSWSGGRQDSHPRWSGSCPDRRLRRQAASLADGCWWRAPPWR